MRSTGTDKTQKGRKRSMAKPVVLVVATLLATVPLLGLAAGNLEVTQQTLLLRSSDYASANYYIEITNTGDGVTQFSTGNIKLEDAQGKQLVADSFSTIYPQYLAPGEKAYYDSYVSLRDVDVASVANVSISLTQKATAKGATPRMPATVAFAQEEENTLVATLTNDSQQTARDILVIFALYDERDTLIYASEQTLYGIGLPAGGSLEVEDRISSTVQEAWQEAQVSPQRLEVIAFENDRNR